MIWLKLESERVRVEKEYLIWLFNPREWDCDRVRDRWVWESREIERAQHWAVSTLSTTVVSDGFESERMKEKNRFENLRLGLLVKSKMMLFGPLQFFFFFFFFLNNRLNPVLAEICRNLPEWPEWPETAWNLTRGGMEGFLVPVYISVRKISTVQAGTERY